MNAPSELSFLPDDYLERKGRRRANALLATVAVAVLGTIGGGFWWQERQMREIDSRHATVQNEYAEAAKRIEQVNAMRAQQRQVVRRAELASSLVEKIPRSNILAEFTNKLPVGVSLLDLTLESRPRKVEAPPQSAFEAKAAALDPRKVQQPEPVKYDVHVRLSGVAETDIQVAQFITRLNGSPLMQNVDLVISDMYQQENQVMRRFQIDMMLDPQAEVKPTLPGSRQQSATVEINEK